MRKPTLALAACGMLLVSTSRVPRRLMLRRSGRGTQTSHCRRSVTAHVVSLSNFRGKKVLLIALTSE